MLRTDNPTNALLKGSWCYFEVADASPELKLPPLLANEVAARGGALERVPGSNGDGATRLEIPHDQTDAFGGLLCLAEMCARKAVAGPSTTTQSGEMRGQLREHVYRHAWRKALPHSPSCPRCDRTVTQIFIERLLPSFPELVSDRIALPVACDDLTRLDSEAIWGNSLIIVTYTGKELSALSQLPRAEWGTALRERAARTLAILERGRSASAFDGPLLISSLGSLDRLPWAPDLDPSSLAMVPTPIHPRSANLVLWSKGSVQGLTLCALPGHGLFGRWEALESAWRNSLEVDS